MPASPKSGNASLPIRPLFLSLALLALSCALAMGAGLAGNKPASEPVTVSVALVSAQNILIQTELAATVQAAERAAIAAKITGAVTRAPVVLGGTVRPAISWWLSAPRRSTLASTKPRRNWPWPSATSNASRTLLAKNAATPDAVKALADQYAMAQAAHREARTMLGYATITAPFDGVVTRKNVSAGDLATAGTVLLQIENNHRLQAAAVPESLVLQIALGDTLDSAGAGCGHRCPGDCGRDRAGG